jgi:hypothetical protein
MLLPQNLQTPASTVLFPIQEFGDVFDKQNWARKTHLASSPGITMSFPGMTTKQGQSQVRENIIICTIDVNGRDLPPSSLDKMYTYIQNAKKMFQKRKPGSVKRLQQHYLSLDVVFHGDSAGFS